MKCNINFLVAHICSPEFLSKPYYKFIAMRDFYDQSAMANIFKSPSFACVCTVYTVCTSHVMMITKKEKKNQLQHEAKPPESLPHEQIIINAS